MPRGVTISASFFGAQKDSDEKRKDVEVHLPTSNASRPARFVPLVLGTFGFALFLAASLLVRNDASDASGVFIANHYVGRIAKIAVCFLVALLCKSRIPRTSRLFVLACVFEAFYLVFAYGLVPIVEFWFPFDSDMAYGLVRVLDYMAGALFTLLFLHFIAQHPPRYAGSCIAAALAGAHIVFVISIFLPEALVFWLKPLLLIVAPAILAFCLWKPCIFLTDQSLKAVSGEQAVGRRGFSFLGATKDLALVLLGVVVFPFLYALIIEISANAGVNLALFGAFAEVMGIAALLFLSVVMWFWRDGVSIEAIFMFVLPLFATAMLLLPFFWGNELFISGLMLKCGYLLYNALLWSLLVKQAKGDSRTIYQYFGIACGMLYLFTLLGRTAGYELSLLSWIDASTIANVSLVVVWVLAMSLLVFFLISHKRENEMVAAMRKESEGIRSRESFAQQCCVFSQKYGLSERETEVLEKFASGRSADYIAKEFYISKNTVKMHIRRIYAKAGIHNRQELLDGIEASNVTNADSK